MGVFDKLAFWKKKDDFGLGKDFGKDFGADLGLGSMGQDNLGMPDFGMGRDAGIGQAGNLGMPEDIRFGTGRQAASSPYSVGRTMPMQQPFGTPPVQPSAPTEHDYARDKFEVVSAKLDSIRYTLDSINQRLANLERAAYGEDPRKRW